MSDIWKIVACAFQEGSRLREAQAASGQNLERSAQPKQTLGYPYHCNAFIELSLERAILPCDAFIEMSLEGTTTQHCKP
eukprot:2128650-Amphidinium_carterae.1